MANAQDALQAAIESLGAVEVAPGFYAWDSRSDEYKATGGTMNAYRVAPASVLANPKAFDRHGGLLMPAWWTPERRFAHKNGSAVCNCLADHDGWERITGDLATGEEVPA